VVFPDAGPGCTTRKNDNAARSRPPQDRNSGRRRQRASVTVSSTDTTRRHRADANPQGRPASELVDQYWTPTARADAQPVKTA